MIANKRSDSGCVRLWKQKTNLTGQMKKYYKEEKTKKKNKHTAPFGLVSISKTFK